MPANKAITGQHSIAAIVPLTTDGTGAVTGIGTVVPFDYVAESGPKWPASEAAANTEYIEGKISTGAIVEYAKNTKKYYPDGTEKTGGGSGSKDAIVITINEFGKTLAGIIPPLRGQLVLAVIPIGDNVTGSEEGYYYLLGRLSSGVEYLAKPDEVVTITLEITGAEVSATAGGDTALAWAPPEIDPVDGAAMTPTPLVSGDVTNLKKGMIIVK